MAQAVDPAIETFASIKVVGVGGAGGAAINRMVDAGVTGVDFVAVNADAQALHHSRANKKVHIGKDTTKGLGAGADPALGRRSAEESLDDITDAVKGADMVFVTFGAGGGTGSGAGPLVARLAHDSGALTVGFATKPFAFEGEKRRRNAEVAIDELRKNVDTLITVPNDKLLQTIDRRTPLIEAFKVADEVLRQGVQGISDLITVHGLVNLDFADVQTVMRNAGSALMGIGRASGENRAIEAAQQAISSPLLEVSIDGARGVLFNVIGGTDMSMHEINTVAETITSAADPEANIIFGATVNPDLEGEIVVTVVATGFDESYYASRNQAAAKLFKDTTEQDHVVQPTPPLAHVSEDKEPQLADTGAHDFHSDETPNIWALPEDEPKAEEEELEKPSFLRRFKLKAKKKFDDEIKKDDNTDDNASASSSPTPDSENEEEHIIKPEPLGERLQDEEETESEKDEDKKPGDEEPKEEQEEKKEDKEGKKT